MAAIQRMIRAVRRALLILPLVIALLGLAGEVALRVRAGADAGLVVAEGPFWRSAPERQRPATLIAAGGRLGLRPEVRLGFPGVQGLRELRWRGRLLEPTGRFCVAFRTTLDAAAAEHNRVEVDLSDGLSVRLVEVRDGQVELPRDPVRHVGAFARGADLSYRMRFEDDGAQLFVDDELVFTGPARGGLDCALWVAGCDATISRIGITTRGGRSLDDDLQALRPVPAAALALEAAIPIVLLHLVVALLCGALALGSPGSWRLGFAALVALILYNLHLAAGLFESASAGAIARALRLASPLGLLLGVYTLRGFLRTPALRAPRARAIAVIASFSLLAATLCGSRVHDALQPRVERERRDVRIELDPATHALLGAVPRTIESVLRLDAGNALRVDGHYRDFTLTAEVVLGDGALLEMRTRADDAAALGVALFLAADASFPPGIYLEAHERFERISAPAVDASGARARLVPGRLHRVELEARGRNFVARQDGREIARARGDATFTRGAIVVLAARGAVEVRSLHVSPHPAALADVPATWPRSTLAAFAPLLLLGAYVWLARRMLGLPWLKTAEASAFGVLPFVLAVAVFSDRGVLAVVPWAWCAFASSVLLLLLPMMHAPRLTFGRFLALALAAPILSGVALRCATLPAGLPDDARARNVHLNALTYLDGHAGHLAADHLHLQHPLVRRFNGYLVEHRFRDRVAVSPPPDSAPRARALIVALGSSSTFGYLLQPGSGEDYPSRLQFLLGQHGRDALVVNAAWSGATAARIHWFLRNVIVPLQPDVVTLSLSYNDAVALSQGDEGAWFERVAAVDQPPGRMARARERLFIQHERVRLEQVTRDFAVAGGGDTLAHWIARGGSADDHPAARFERELRRCAALADEHGFRLVLIKEAVAGNRDRIWKQEFRAAMDRVAHDTAVAICDPTHVLLQAERRLAQPLFFDEVHLTALGCQLMAWSLRPHVEALLPPLPRKVPDGD